MTNVQTGKSHSFVINQSKAEAKRLLKLAMQENGIIHVGKLSDAQQIISKLKGFDNWHSLQKEGSIRGEKVFSPEPIYQPSFYNKEMADELGWLFSKHRANDLMNILSIAMPLENFKFQTSFLINFLSSYSTYLRDEKGVPIYFESQSPIFTYTSFHKLHHLLRDENIPIDHRDLISRYLNSLPGYVALNMDNQNVDVIDIHIEIEKTIHDIFQSIHRSGVCLKENYQSIANDESINYSLDLNGEYEGDLNRFLTANNIYDERTAKDYYTIGMGSKFTGHRNLSQSVIIPFAILVGRALDVEHERLRFMDKATFIHHEKCFDIFDNQTVIMEAYAVLARCIDNPRFHDLMQSINEHAYVSTVFVYLTRANGGIWNKYALSHRLMNNHCRVWNLLLYFYGDYFPLPLVGIYAHFMEESRTRNAIQNPFIETVTDNLLDVMNERNSDSIDENVFLPVFNLKPIQGDFSDVEGVPTQSILKRLFMHIRSKQ